MSPGDVWGEKIEGVSLAVTEVDDGLRFQIVETPRVVGLRIDTNRCVEWPVSGANILERHLSDVMLSSSCNYWNRAGYVLRVFRVRDPIDLDGYTGTTLPKDYVVLGDLPLEEIGSRS